MAKKKTTIESIRARKVLEDIEKRVIVNAQGQKADLTVTEELLYAILKVLAQ